MNPDDKPTELETIWPPPPDRPASQPVERVTQRLLTNVVWLDALLGVLLGLGVFVAALVGVALVQDKLFPTPPHSQAELLLLILSAGGLSGIIFWLIGRWFHTWAVAAAVAVAIPLTFLLLMVLMFWGMMG